MLSLRIFTIIKLGCVSMVHSRISETCSFGRLEARSYLTNMEHRRLTGVEQETDTTKRKEKLQFVRFCDKS